MVLAPDQLKHRIPKYDMVDFLDVFDFGPNIKGTCTDNFFEIRILGKLFCDMIDAKVKKSLILPCPWHR